MVFRILRPDSSTVWNNEEIVKRFSKYRGILDGKEIARYLIAKSIDCNFNPSDSIENLENLLKEKSNEFQELLNLDFEELKNREVKASSYIDLATTIANRYLESCIFCERKCGADRTKDKKGYCSLTEKSYVSSAFLHFGEESVLVPSGTIFFQSCNFACVFCQNFDISQAWKGRRELEDIAQKVDVKKLAAIAEKLGEKGALNINYVGGDPIPNLHTIVGSLKYQVSNICQLWNSNFYLTKKALSLIIDLMDFWLPDWKYGNNECGKKYSGIENYFDVISRNHKQIHDEGSGEICIRHLVMPNHVECCSKPILDYVANEIPKCVVNIMGQYRPQYKANKYKEISRHPTSREMADVKNYADKLGILFEPVS